MTTESSPRPRFVRRAAPHLAIWMMAATYLVSHVAFLPQTPFDIDGVNFALALHEYDLAKHQPHPPGSPVFVGLGRLARAPLALVFGIDSVQVRSRALDAAALAIWSATLGALAIFGLFRLYAGLGQSAWRAALATAVTVTCPLFWFSGVRVLSDMPGLAIGVMALGVSVPALMGRAVSPRALVLGCFLAGLAPGLRIQMAWFTWPAVAAATMCVLRRRDAGWRPAIAAFVAGLLSWLVPLAWAAGGPAEYVRLFQIQAAEDIASGQMLAVDFTARKAAQALMNSLVAPWGAGWLGWIAVGCAVAGAVHLLRRGRRALATLALVFGPYAALHVGFQDTSFVRYALPLVPLAGLLIVHGLLQTAGRPGIVAAGALCVASLAIAAPAVASYGNRPAPVYQALDDVRQQLPLARRPPVLAMHASIRLAARGEPIVLNALPSPVRHEWLELVKHWRTGSTAPVWFLASRRRTDLTLIDPRSQSLVKSYVYPTRSGALLAGSRPRSVNWIELSPPGWVALEGWAMTPEIRGATVRADRSRHAPTPQVLIRRRPDEVAIVLGGRNLGGPCATGALIAVSIDGREVLRFTARVGESFARVWRMPAGALDGDGVFAQLTITTEDQSGAGRQVDVAFEQFDVQGSENPVVALTEGWFEPEYEPREEASFRWMSDHGTVYVDAFGRDVVMRIRGAASRQDFAQPSVLVVRVGETVLDTRTVVDHFTIDVPVPAELLSSTGGRIEIEASQSFVPDELFGNGDRRALAIRIFGVEIHPPDPPVARPAG